MSSFKRSPCDWNSVIRSQLQSRMEANYKFMLVRHNFPPIYEVALQLWYTWQPVTGNSFPRLSHSTWAHMWEDRHSGAYMSSFPFSSHFPIPCTPLLELSILLIWLALSPQHSNALHQFCLQFIISTQATIDLVIGYDPPSTPHPNDLSGTSVSGVGGKLNILETLPTPGGI